MIKSVAVYCGHQPGTNPEYIKAARKVGELLGKYKIKVVFGGGDVGLMGAVATAAVQNGAEVVGVSTHHVIAKQEPMHEDVKSVFTSGVNERKQQMYELSDAFCILPGGIGTLNELTDIMTMQQIGESQKPIFFLNTAKFWDIFGQILVHMEQDGFIPDMKVYNMKIANTPEDLLKLILQKEDFITRAATTDKFDV